MSRIGSLCSGYRGLDLAVQAILGGHVVWDAEYDPDASKILAHHWPNTPNHGDITRVDWTSVEPVEVLTAGFPCQDLSYAGRGAGIQEGNRSGLWYHVARAVGVLRPRLFVAENVAAIVTRRPGLDVVLADLAALGFDAEWVCVPASAVGAPHGRDRWFLAAHPADDGRARPGRPRSGGHGPAHSRVAAPDTDRDGCGRLEELHGLPQTGRETRGDRDNTDGLAVASRGVGWGVYAPAVHRWERLLGRPAPVPRERGRNGQPRLNPAFVEWMQGLPAGHVTAVPGLTHGAQLKALGNGVVPQQAAAALTWLLQRGDVAA
jgi:DNA (cytosine-5)-methyltransferase 1